MPTRPSTTILLSYLLSILKPKCIILLLMLYLDHNTGKIITITDLDTIIVIHFVNVKNK